MKQHSLRLLALTGIVGSLLGFAGGASAQVVVPEAARPNVGERINRIKNVRPDVGGKPVIYAPEQAAKKIGDGTKFTLNSIKLEGATVYGEEVLKPLYAEKLGTKVTLDELNQIAADITAYYRNEGYILTRAVVPPQAAKGGNITLRIVEGFVNDVKLQGDVTPGNERNLQAYANKIRDAKPLNAAALERYLLLMEDLPGVEARAVLQPAAAVTGATDVIVTIKRKMVDFLASTDNRGTKYLGRQQANASIYFNDVVGLDEQTQIRIAGTPGDREELQFGEIRHEQQIGKEGTTALFSANVVRTKPGFTLDSIDLNGESIAYSAGVSHPLLRSRRANWFVNSDFTMRDINVKTPGLNVYRDKTRVWTAGTAYDFVDSTSAINRLESNFAKGFNWDAGSDGNARSRATATPDFEKLTGRLSRIQPISGPWSAAFTAAGQYSFDPLFASEEFALGGADFGSAYDPSEITGDSGFGTRLELQFNQSQESNIISQYQLYGFYDYGEVFNRSPASGSEVSYASLQSAGAGVRFTVLNNVTGSVEGSFPLSRPVAVYGDNDGRAFFSLQYRY